MSSIKLPNEESSSSQGAPNMDNYLSEDDMNNSSSSSSNASQNEMKNQALQDLVFLQTEEKTEDRIRVIFYRYAQPNESVWLMNDVRLFLFDLEESFGLARVIPDEALVEVAHELQISSQSSNSAVVTWLDFKSYMLYIQTNPLQSLHNIILRSVPKDCVAHAVHITSLPNNITKEHILAIFSPCGPVAKCYINQDSAPEALLCFNASDGAAAALQMTGVRILNTPVQVKPYIGQDFPSLIYKRKPSFIAKSLAKVIVTAQNIDEHLHIVDRVKQGAEKVEHLAEEYKVVERTVGVARKVDETLKLSATANHINQRYQITNTAYNKYEQVRDNQHVQKVTNVIGGITSMVFQKVSELKEDTNAVVAEHNSKQQHQTNQSSEFGTQDRHQS